MLESLLALNGIQKLSRKEQQSINGSGAWGIEACEYYCAQSGWGQGVLQEETACECD